MGPFENSVEDLICCTVARNCQKQKLLWEYQTSRQNSRPWNLLAFTILWSKKSAQSTNLQNIGPFTKKKKRERLIYILGKHAYYEKALFTKKRCKWQADGGLCNSFFFFSPPPPSLGPAICTNKQKRTRKIPL